MRSALRICSTIWILALIIPWSNAQDQLISLGGTFASQVNFFDYENENFSSNSETSSGVQLVAGIRVRYHFLEQLVLTTGASYSLQTFTHQHNLNPSFPFSPKETKLYVGSLRLPFLLSYQFGTTDWRVLPTAGVNLDLFLFDHERTINENGLEFDSGFHDSEITSFRALIRLELGIEKGLGDAVSIGFAPYSTFALNSLDVSYVTGPEIGLGVLVGVYLNL